MITLQKLIKVAPFPEDVRQKLLAASDTLSDSKRLELVELCWSSIALMYQNKLRIHQEIATLEMAQGNKMYSDGDLKKMEDEIYKEIMEKFEAESTEDELNEVRERLAKLKN